MDKVIALIGPTASGKSQKAIELAKEIGGVIIGADAFQAYKGLEVITAAPSQKDKEEVPHLLYGFLEPTAYYSVADYQAACRKAIDEVHAQGKTPIIVGGTLLYVRAALFDYCFEDFEKASIDESESTENLYDLLNELDPETAAAIHPHNRVRITRALILALSGHPMSKIEKADMSKPYYPNTEFIRVEPDREELYAAIDKRVDRMFLEGAVEEVKAFIDQYGLDVPAGRAIGVKEIAGYLNGGRTLEEAKDMMKKATRNYAKRQLTFLRHQFPKEG